uniref:Uncharacterized protein n=1 Tax=Lepeophtheirus salmonis TaxID=72036 RepID=A0A0K2VAX2_LEPSM
MEGKAKLFLQVFYKIVYKSSNNYLAGIREVMAKKMVEKQLQNASKNSTVPPRRVTLDISNKIQNIHCNLTSSKASIRRIIQRIWQINKARLPLPLPFEDVISVNDSITQEKINRDDVKGMLIFMSSFGQEIQKLSSLWMTDYM